MGLQLLWEEVHHQIFSQEAHQAPHRRDAVLVLSVRQDLLLPAVLPQAHALPHGREAAQVRGVRARVQGAEHAAQPRADPQRRAALRLRDLRQELPTAGEIALTSSS